MARRKGFGASLRNLARVDHGDRMLSAKVALRARVLDAVQPAHVFDAYAGAGSLYRHAWCNAESYVGCDLEWFRDDRACFVADNRRVLRSIDLAPFNVFDLDAYGSPWEQAWIIAVRRHLAPGERIAVVLSEGSSLKLKMGGAPNAALLYVANMVSVPAGAAILQDQLTARAIERLAGRMGARVAERWQVAGKVGSRMHYIALVLEKKKPAGAVPAD